MLMLLQQTRIHGTHQAVRMSIDGGVSSRSRTMSSALHGGGGACGVDEGACVFCSLFTLKI
jgi:hypothetical protein